MATEITYNSGTQQNSVITIPTTTNQTPTDIVTGYGASEEMIVELPAPPIVVNKPRKVR